ncbi:MAG: glycosyltransferase family 2 protein [Rhodothermales bacterium]|nr:glycosyltransferase family 2 protein [Rhodothermales bacterium]
MTRRETIDPSDIPTGRPSVSVVIVSWNALDIVRRCLPSVVRTNHPSFEIVFADNASTDGTPDWVEANHPGVRVIRHSENLRFTRGNNAAVRQARGRFVVLLNNDVEVDPDWLSPLVDRMEADPSIGAVQPKLMQFDDRDRFEYSGASGGYLDRFGYPFTRGRVFFTMEDDAGQYDQAGPVFWATGAAVMFRTEVYVAAGGLEESFDMHMEEIDLCWRLQRAGYRVEAVPESVIWHIGGASLPSTSSEKAYLNFRNNLLTLYRNWPRRVWLRRFPVRAILDVLAVLRAILAGRPRESAAIVRAYRDAHRMKSSFTASLPPSAPGADADSVEVDTPYEGSIVLDYFLFGRRTFSELPRSRFRGGYLRP